MILVDSSVWIDHFRSDNTALAALLEDELVWMHSLVIGELASGSLRKRSAALRDLRRLPRIAELQNDEAVHLIEVRRWFGLGLSFVDIHLLGACLIASARLWSLDRRLAETASRLGIAA